MTLIDRFYEFMNVKSIDRNKIRGQ